MFYSNILLKSQNFRITSVVIITVVFLLFNSIQVYAAESTSRAKVVEIYGKAWVKKSGGQREFAVFKGMYLSQGDWIRTESYSSLKIQYDNDTESTVGPNSQLFLEISERKGDSSRTKVKLTAGSIWNKVKNLLNIGDQYEVETPTAVMGVRGTLFLASYNNVTGESMGNVVDGTVGIRNNLEQVQFKPEHKVNMGEEMEIDLHQEAAPAKKELDTDKLVQQTDPKIIVQIIEDATARADEFIGKAQTAQKGFEQKKDEALIKNALTLAKKSSELTKFADTFVKKVGESSKSKEVEEVLKANNRTLKNIQESIVQIKNEAVETESSIKQDAEQAGISTENIEEVVEEAPAAPVPVVEEPILDEPAPTESNSNDGSNDSVNPPQIQLAWTLTKSYDGALTSDFIISQGLSDFPYFAIYTKSGVQITDVIPNGQPVRSLSAAFNQLSDLEVRFYTKSNDNTYTLLNRGSLTGSVIGGIGEGQVVIQ